MLLGVFGAAGTAGNIAATRLTRRMEPARLARTAKILQIPVFWVLAFTSSAPAFAGVLAVTGLCNGLLAGPVAGIQLTRTPAALRPKVMTALLSASLLAGSLGTLTAGQILHAGFATGFLIVAATQTLFGGVFLYGAGRHVR